MDLDRGCVGKVRHLTHEAAEHAVRRPKGRKGQRIDVYRCPACGFWHVGGNARRVPEPYRRERFHLGMLA